MSLLLVFGVAWVAMIVNGELLVDYYRVSCPKAEHIVHRVVKAAVKKDITLGAGLVRMNFHDCFVEGCDASILLDSTPGNVAEKDFPANNPSLRGYEVLDAAKRALEKSCPGVVSCADIIAFAARDAVGLLGGPAWKTRAGRKDGKFSSAARAGAFLPFPNFNITQLKDNFAQKQLTVDELVTLSGGHTLGVSHCQSFSSRLYNNTGVGDQDPTLDPSFAESLISRCPAGKPDPSTTVTFDDTPFSMDADYFSQVRQGRGLLTTDAALLDDPYTAAAVIHNELFPHIFLDKFVTAMVKLSEIEVKGEDEGEVRWNCRRVND